MRQKTFTFDQEWQDIKVGDEVVLLEYTDILNGGSSWEARIAPDGIGGNMDSSVKRYHGWRGTTNDVSATAHGLRKVLKASRVERDGDTLLKITVGPDLHPDWD